MHATIDGVSFHVQELGRRSEQPSIVMLHGLFLGSIASWYFSAAPALARTRHVLLYDLRGHGKSERTPSGYDVGTMARDLAAIADRFTEGPIDLVGHSYGALVALRFALDHKRRARRLALVEAPLPPSSFRELDDFVAADPTQMIAALPADLRALVTAGGRRASKLLDAIRFLAAESTLLSDLRRESDIADDELRRLDLPVLAAYGERSSCKSAGERIARVVDGARLAMLPGGHYLHLDAPSELTRVLTEFLDG
jgi:pimeloyl-ACP methyl ester carboxylesterase